MSRIVPIVASVVLVAGVIAVSPAAVQPSRAAAWGFIRLENVVAAADIGIAEPGALAWDAAAKALVITDAATGRAVVVSPQGGVRGERTRGNQAPAGALSTRDAITGHGYTLDLARGIVSETGRDGAVVSRRNVANLHLKGVRGMTVAQTADTTDAAAARSLYLSVANASDAGSATGPGILELSLSAPVVSLALAGTPDNVGHKIKEIDTTATNWHPFSPDPSGIAYAGSTRKLVVDDGEIEETNVNNYPYPGINVWNVDPVTGAGDGIIDTTAGSPINKEPVGVAWDPDRNELYISRDGSSSAVWAYTWSGTQWALRDQRLVTGFGVADAEGLAFGDGNLYIGDGTNKEIWIVGPGPDGKVATADDVPVSHFDTAGLGISDPEGVGIDHNTGHVWILSHKDGEGMVETLTDGTPVSTTHFDFPTLNPGGLDIAPTSSTTDDPSAMSAWVAQRGVDNNNDPNEKDGKIFEVSIQSAGPPPPPGDNLLVNGDFESGTPGTSPTGWSANTNFTTSSAVVHGGSFSGRHFSAADAAYTIEQTVNATAGTTYDFSAWANPPPTTDTFKIVLKVQWRTATKALSTVTITKITKATPAGWNDYVQSMVAPAGTAKVRVFMVVSSLKTTVYVDDISIATAP